MSHDKALKAQPQWAHTLPPHGRTAYCVMLLGDAAQREAYLQQYSGLQKQAVVVEVPEDTRFGKKKGRIKDEALAETIKSALKQGKNLLLTGDFCEAADSGKLGLNVLGNKTMHAIRGWAEQKGIRYHYAAAALGTSIVHEAGADVFDSHFQPAAWPDEPHTKVTSEDMIAIGRVAEGPKGKSAL